MDKAKAAALVDSLNGLMADLGIRTRYTLEAGGWVRGRLDEHVFSYRTKALPDMIERRRRQLERLQAKAE